VLARLLEAAPSILSTGGGAYLSDRNREIIGRHGIAVWLRADPDLLWSRVRHKTTRPLLRTENPRATLVALHDARAPDYAKAEVTVDARPDCSVDAMAMRVIDALLTHPDVLEATP
jgi:shikimate kinase